MPERTEGSKKQRAHVGTDENPLDLYRSEKLFGLSNAIGIDHRGQRYVLRITRQGKLILTKPKGVEVG